MPFVVVKSSVHIGRLRATDSIFTAAVPDVYPAILQSVSIDESVQIGRPRMPAKQAIATFEFIDSRAAYEQRRILADDYVVIQDSENGAASVIRFRGRAYRPNVTDLDAGRIRIEVKAIGLWQRLIELPDVSVDAIRDANGKQAVDSILDAAGWPTAFRDIPTPINGANAEYGEWSFEGKPAAGIATALAGINPRSRYWIDATGVLRVTWIPANIKQYGLADTRKGIRFKETDLHVINQVLVPSIDVSRVTTTRWTSTVAYDLTDDDDTVIYQATLQGGSDNATLAFRLRQLNGTYFPAHADVTATLTTSYIRGTDSLYNVVLTARSISGDYTTAVNFFQLRDTVVTFAQSANPPAVHNLRNVAASEPRTYELPPLAYADADVTETLGRKLSVCLGPSV